jgi:L-glutamine-phosphate cytidylyltransferase
MSRALDQDEHMKVRAQQGRLQRLSKDLPQMHTHGESLGVAHLSTLAARAAFAAAGSLIRRGHVDEWAASAINEVARHHRISCMDVAAQPWVEIDFPEDLEHARNHTWPAIAALLREHSSAEGFWSTSMEPDDLKEVAT